MRTGRRHTQTEPLLNKPGPLLSTEEPVNSTRKSPALMEGLPYKTPVLHEKRMEFGVLVCTVKKSNDE